MAVYKPELIRITKNSGNCPYLRTSFWKKGKAIHKSVHRLVAQHFISNPNRYSSVLHLDNDPQNAHFKNLKWGTQKHNIQHAVECSRWHLGVKNNKAKLNPDKVLEIRELLKSGKSAYSIAPLFGVGKCQILSIKNGRTWKHVK
jgi:hypothetical protein